MEVSILHRKSNLFTQQNLAHYFLLGLASLSLDLPAQFALSTQSQDFSRINEVEDDRYLHFMLGLLVISRKFNHILTAEKEWVDIAKKESVKTAVTENASIQLHHLLR